MKRKYRTDLSSRSIIHPSATVSSLVLFIIRRVLRDWLPPIKWPSVFPIGLLVSTTSIDGPSSTIRTGSFTGAPSTAQREACGWWMFDDDETMSAFHELGHQCSTSFQSQFYWLRLTRKINWRRQLLIDVPLAFPGRVEREKKNNNEENLNVK